MNSVETQIWIGGVLWEVEIEFWHQPDEDSTGMVESIDINKVWLLGFYPEGRSNFREYVAVNVRVNLRECSPSELEAYETAVYSCREVA